MHFFTGKNQLVYELLFVRTMEMPEALKVECLFTNDSGLEANGTW